MSKTARKLVAHLLRGFLWIGMRNSKERRNAAHHYAEIFSLHRISWKTLRCFRKRFSEEKSILLVESADYHGEVLAGMLEYYRDLGYTKIDCLLTPRQSLTPYLKNLVENVYVADEIFFRFILKQPRLQDYHRVVFHTFEARNFSVQRYLKHNPILQARAASFTHKLPSHIPSSLDGKMMVLNQLAYNPQVYKPVSAHRFQISQPQGEDIRFLAIGARNWPLFFSTIKPTAFITIITRSKIDIPPAFRPYIRLIVNCSYAELFAECQQHHFLLALLNSQQPDGYLTESSSGNMQLARGFALPPLIEGPFAKAYGFTEQTAVIHAVNGLQDAMETAPSRYTALRQNLINQTAELTQQSLLNLKACLDA
jgi:hypothetical protein